MVIFSKICLMLLLISIFIAVFMLIFDIDEVVPLPILDLSTVNYFVAIFSASGYLLNKITDNLIIIILISTLVSIVLTTIIYLVLKPIKKTEATMAYDIKDLIGNEASVITNISGDSVGEIFINTGLVVNNRPAKSIDGSDIESGKKVLIMEIKENIFYVKEK